MWGVIFLWLCQAVVDIETTTARVIYTGKCCDEVEAFFFTYNKVVTRYKSEKDQSVCFFAYPNGDLKASNLGKFTVGWSLTDEGCNNNFVWKGLLEQFKTATDPDKLN